MAEITDKKPEEKPAGQKMSLYVCTEKCYWNDRLWKTGDKTEAEVKPEHFEKVK